MKTVSVPREECRDEIVTLTRSTRDPNQIAGSAPGAVVGGILGNQVGGAVAGGYAGNKVQEGMQERNTYQESQRTCSTIYDKRQEQSGYDVRYRLDGLEQTVHMAYDPGRRIAVENGSLVIEDLGPPYLRDVFTRCG